MGCSLGKQHAVVHAPRNNKFIDNSVKTPTGMLNKNSNFGENAHALRQIINIEPPKIYRTDELNLSENQYELVNDSLLAMNRSLVALQSIYRATKLTPPQIDVKEEISYEVKNQIDAANAFKKSLNDLNSKRFELSDPLFLDSFSKIESVIKFLKDEKKLKELINNPNAEKFFHKNNFDASTVINFNVEMLKIAVHATPENLQNTKVINGFGTDLVRASELYACKGIIENQLPKVKQNFKNMRGKLDKEFLTIVESVIKFTEVGLKNINNDKRAAILEKISPTLRPTSYGKYYSHLDLFHYHKDSIVLKKTVEEIADIVRELKEIPLLLA
jgi:hypothetical protein